jgi:hypothetical protein
LSAAFLRNFFFFIHTGKKGERMKAALYAPALSLALLIPVHSDIVLGDTPQVAVENYQSTPADRSLIVGRNSTFWDIQWATGFKTGSERSVLHAALFLYNGAWYGTSGGFRFALHADNSGLPGSQTALLNGPDRPVNGITWYTADSRLELDADTVYWLVASAPQTESPRFFEWRGTSSGAEISHLPGWELLDHGALRTNEGAWTSSGNIGHTAVQVQAIPEPMSAALLFSLSGLFFVRRILLPRA